MAVHVQQISRPGGLGTGPSQDGEATGNDFDAERFITATFPLPRAAEAFAAIAAGGEVKILVVADRGNH